MYTVIAPFSDLQDGLRHYSVGSTFPAEGAPQPSPERIASLLGVGNKQGRPLIAEVDPEAEKQAAEEAKKAEKEAKAAEKKAAATENK